MGNVATEQTFQRVRSLCGLLFDDEGSADNSEEFVTELAKGLHLLSASLLATFMAKHGITLPKMMNLLFAYWPESKRPFLTEFTVIRKRQSRELSLKTRQLLLFDTDLRKELRRRNREDLI